MSESGKPIDADVLKPLYQRAAEAEERISRLEAAVSSKKAAGNEYLQKIVSECQPNLEDENVEQISEGEKIKKLAAENQKLITENRKLKYRITHLIRAVEAADQKLKSFEMELGTSEVNK